MSGFGADLLYTHQSQTRNSSLTVLRMESLGELSQRFICGICILKYHKIDKDTAPPTDALPMEVVVLAEDVITRHAD